MDDPRKEEAISRYLPLFKRHGFGDYGIDFSDAQLEAIVAMGEALEALDARNAVREHKAPPEAVGDQLSFSELREANVTRCERYYHPIADWSMTDWLTCVAGEIGELAAAVDAAGLPPETVVAVTSALGRLAGAIKNHRRKQTESPNGHPIGPSDAIAIGNEAADVVIYVDDLCARAGIDLGAAVRRKFNLVSRERLKCDILLPEP